MKLVLSSAGFSAPAIVRACVELCGKAQQDISVAIINEAYAVEDGDKYWVLDNLNDVANNFKGGLDIVDLLALPLHRVKEKIMQRDVIFVVGGHTDYLMHVFKTTGFADLLPDLLKTKVYVGSSAGSMVLGKRLPAKAYATIYAEQNTYGTDAFLEFVDFALLPHLDSPDFNNREETLAGITWPDAATIYSLKDDSAVVVRDGQQTVVGSAPLTIANGRLTAT